VVILLLIQIKLPLNYINLLKYYDHFVKAFMDSYIKVNLKKIKSFYLNQYFILITQNQQALYALKCQLKHFQVLNLYIKFCFYEVIITLIIFQ